MVSANAVHIHMYKHIYTSESEESGETGAKATERTAQKEAERTTSTFQGLHYSVRGRQGDLLSFFF